jgi:hypothetical protein
MYAGGNLFVATNADAEAVSILGIGNMQDALTSTTGGPRSTKGRITRKLAWKFGRWYSEDRSLSGAGEIFHLIKASQLKQLNLGKNEARKAFQSSGNTYVIIANQDGRHAEEKLMDLLELADYRARAVVAGKKRPCGTCLGRMQQMKENGFDVIFGQRPGLIWKESFQRQPLEVRQVTLRELKARSQYVSDIGQGYASESDSDIEE